jgi:hypothetical protein
MNYIFFEMIDNGGEEKKDEGWVWGTPQLILSADHESHL